jgi:hypothetical protein
MPRISRQRQVPPMSILVACTPEEYWSSSSHLILQLKPSSREHVVSDRGTVIGIETRVFHIPISNHVVVQGLDQVTIDDGSDFRIRLRYRLDLSSSSIVVVHREILIHRFHRSVPDVVVARIGIVRLKIVEFEDLLAFAQGRQGHRRVIFARNEDRQSELSQGRSTLPDLVDECHHTLLRRNPSVLQCCLAVCLHFVDVSVVILNREFIGEDFDLDNLDAAVPVLDSANQYVLP